MQVLVLGRGGLDHTCWLPSCPSALPHAGPGRLLASSAVALGRSLGREQGSMGSGLSVSLSLISPIRPAGLSRGLGSCCLGWQAGVESPESRLHLCTDSRTHPPPGSHRRALEQVESLESHKSPFQMKRKAYCSVYTNIESSRGSGAQATWLPTSQVFLPARPSCLSRPDAAQLGILHIHTPSAPQSAKSITCLGI